MILRKILSYVTFMGALTCSYLLQAQRESTIWYFGYHAGLSFKGGDPVGLKDGVIKADQGTAVISDKDSGDLLFYTDGRNFWNTQHQLMLGSNLPTKCWTQVTQPAIIIPDKENKYLFNVFCLRYPEEIENSFENNCIYSSKTNTYPGMLLYYFLIDMRLDNGKGGVVEDRSNVLIRTDVTEKLTAIPNANGNDYWILVHGWNSNKFYAYPIISTAWGDPVSSEIGSVHQTINGDSQEIRGYMKASPNGKKIVCAISDDVHPLDLFDFDAQTGSLSNYINLGNLRGQYGASFSPNNSKLYISTDSPSDEAYKYIIMQFDLDEEDSAAIVASGMSIILNNPNTNIPGHGIFEGFDEARKSLQLGLDGRLYVVSHASIYESNQVSNVLVIIDQPNKKGFDCQINYKQFDFGAGRTGIGLPNFMQSYFNDIESITVCDKPLSFNIYPNPTTGKFNMQVLQGCAQTYSFEILNSLGQIVLSKSTFTEAKEVDVSFLAAGLYFVRVTTPGHVILINKIVKI